MIAAKVIRIWGENQSNRTRVPFSNATTDEFEQWTIYTNMFEWQDDDITRNRFIVNDKYKNVDAMMNKVVQFNNCDDSEGLL
jgi:hypothetical protein